MAKTSVITRPISGMTFHLGKPLCSLWDACRLMNLVIFDTWRSSAVEGVVPLEDMFSLSLGVGVDPLGSSYLLFPRPYMK